MRLRRTELLSQTETHERKIWILGVALLVVIVPAIWQIVSQIPVWVDWAVIVVGYFVFLSSLAAAAGGSKDGVNHNT
jgi:hypothetical protein